MIRTIEWHSGFENFKKHTLKINCEKKINSYCLEILDKDIPQVERNIFDIFADYLSIRQNKFVEVLYSGGMDSELVLYSCIVKNIPVKALTMRILIDGVVLNTHDLYYSEKFCKQYNIEQKIVDFDATKFYENGDHYRYLDPYLITQWHVASHFWLFEQATGFPVFGGEYTWPWVGANPMIISPIRYIYSVYDKFLFDNNIHGIGTMLSYGLESNIRLMKSHIKVMNQNPNKFGGDNVKIVFFKNAMCKDLGYSNPELRLKNYGWESIGYANLNTVEIKLHLIKKYGRTFDKIKWNHKIAEVLNSTPGENTKFS